MIKTLAVPRLEVAWTTHTGLIRANNEDAVEVVPLPEESGVLIVVSDGMGGRACGEVASRIVLDRLLKVAPDVSPERPVIERFDAILAALYDADRKMRDAAAGDLRLTGMGATAVVAAVTPRTVLHLHVGDSRLYHFRDGRRLYRTQDHSVVEVMRQIGQIDESQMQHHPSRCMLIASLGGGDIRMQIDVAPKWQEGVSEQEAELALQPGDLVLLCTDGLNGVIGEEILAQNSHLEGDHSVTDLVQRLVDVALEAGGEDNVTVVGVRVAEDPFNTIDLDNRGDFA